MQKLIGFGAGVLPGMYNVANKFEEKMMLTMNSTLRTYMVQKVTGVCVLALVSMHFVVQASAQNVKAENDPESDNSVLTEESLIKTASRAFSAAFVAGDVDGIRKLYTEDGVILPPGRMMRGRQKIGEYFAPAPNRTMVSHSMDSKELKIDGNIAVDIGIWNNKWKIGNGEPQTASGQYLVVWKRSKDGSWRIQYDMWHRPSE